MKTIIGVIFLVFVIIIGLSAVDNQNNINHEQIKGSIEIEEEVMNSEEIEAKVKVVLTGEIKKPGTYYVYKNDYLIDAIDLAKGITSNADESCFDYYLVINEDIEIYIPAISEEEKVSINNATLEQLVANLEGIGPTLANKIIEYREENGNFRYLEELMKVPGIKTDRFNKNKDKICL